MSSVHSQLLSLVGIQRSLRKTYKAAINWLLPKIGICQKKSVISNQRILKPIYEFDEEHFLITLNVKWSLKPLLTIHQRNVAK